MGQLTRHVIATFSLLNIPPAVLSRTFLRKLAYCSETRLLLHLPIVFFLSTLLIIILLTCHIFMPVILMNHADFKSTRPARKDIPFLTTLMNLSRRTPWAYAPTEVGLVVEGAASRECIKPSLVSGY